MSDYIKHSKLGLIPKDWKGSKLSDVVDLIHGYQFRSEDFTNDGIAVIKIGNVMGNDLKLDNLSFIDSSRRENFSQYKIEEGDILMSLTGNIGRVIEVGSLEKEYLQNYRVGKFIPVDSNELKKRYVKYLLSSPLVLSQFFKFSNQSAQANFGKQDMDKVWVTIPTSLPEQQKIAEILSTVDAKIEVIDQQITETQALKKGLMQRLLTKGIGHTEFKESVLGEIPKRWDVVKLGDLAEIVDPQPDHRTPAEVEDGIPYIGMGDINNGKINFDSARKVSQEVLNKQIRGFEIYPEAFVFGKIGTIGNPTPIPMERFYALSANLILMTTKKQEIAKYLYVIIQSVFIENQLKFATNTTSQPALGIKKARELLVPLPKEKEMNQISDVMRQVEEKLRILMDKKVLFEELKQGLMQQLLTGKIRVKTN
jgi:type I restriction enzyme, S subunit